MYITCLGLLIGAAIGFCFNFFSKNTTVGVGDIVFTTVVCGFAGLLVGAAVAASFGFDFVPK